MDMINSQFPSGDKKYQTKSECKQIDKAIEHRIGKASRIYALLQVEIDIHHAKEYHGTSGRRAGYKSFLVSFFQPEGRQEQ